MASLKLKVQWTEETLADFSKLNVLVPFDEDEQCEFKCPKPPLTISDLGQWLEAIVEGLHYKKTGGKLVVQCYSLKDSKHPGRELDFGDRADQHFAAGDTLVVDAQVMTETMLKGAQPPQLSEKDLNDFRKTLRFQLNDRVLCNCGPRWLSGHVVGTAVQDDDDDLLPYLVKTDACPGLPSRSISVPADSDTICKQEVCFDPSSELHLIKAAAPIMSTSCKLRFAVGDKVVCRVRNSSDDGLECWASGSVSDLWPKLHGEKTWEIDGVSGQFADVLPYMVNLSSGKLIYCHKDHHTLIRREGMQPQTRVRGISKRMEDRSLADGSKERLDHQTERRKRIAETDVDDSSD